MTKRSFILILLLLGAIIFSVWLIRYNNRFSLVTAQNLPDTPDAYMTQALFVETDHDGAPRNRMFVPKMVHYAAHDMSEFSQPEITLYTKEHTPWHVVSDSGSSQGGIDQVDLWGNVKIHQPAGPHNNALTIYTQRMTVFPKLKTAKTDAAVTIIQPGLHVYSVGLRADLNKGEVQLLSKAKGIYENQNQ